jgi:2-oxoacid:acceptor oxidoreductase delta subunit (pyruvate/2-ketoisovalerate family)
MKINITAQPNTTLANKTGGWRTFKPKTDLNKCISCGICALVCPERCITMEKIKNYNKEKPITDYAYCKGCGVCAEECPVKAIVMEMEKK